jgi:diaminohydroxyphosphoribosylaminopyrimidine deaminase / 5-amino-6-(5-phosphoribosylamino)uracil reductase
MTSTDGTLASIDQRWMQRAIGLSRLCPPSERAYSVGAVIVGADDQELSFGFSRDSDPVVHAEESALAKLPSGDPSLRGATIYSSLEPCSQRRSRPHTCTSLIIPTGISRVVIAWREPSLFVRDHLGVEALLLAGIVVTEMPEFANAAMAPNAHLPGLRQDDTTGCRPQP